MQNIDKIASKFLGKDSLNNQMATYKAPEQIDSSLLVAIPRIYNREAHNIDAKLFSGFDTWNCYELSTLNAKGRPFAGIMKIFFPANSTNIVESKSLKLYLNSFNLCRLKSVSNDDLKVELEAIITQDLQKYIDDNRIKLKIYDSNSNNLIQEPIEHTEFENIDNLDIDIDENQDESSHSINISDQTGTLKIHSTLLRSNCRVTNQPDWGDVYIHIKANKLPSKESLLQYIVSMRKEQHFHEEICENIYNDLYLQFNPTELLVQCLYTRRGGIDINPIRYTENMKDNKLLEYFQSEDIYKTNRQ
ncbi:NADPH-dependent 7-cyano-7-deazaguanine reductase QueF [Francisellaceae bacterium CB299]|jgi:7-cyano-7-deazaguanine reductase